MTLEEDEQDTDSSLGPPPFPTPQPQQRRAGELEETSRGGPERCFASPLSTVPPSGQEQEWGAGRVAPQRGGLTSHMTWLFRSDLPGWARRPSVAGAACEGPGEAPHACRGVCTPGPGSHRLTLFSVARRLRTTQGPARSMCFTGVVPFPPGKPILSYQPLTPPCAQER